MLEKAYLELQTLNRVQGGYQSLVIAELERRKRIKDLRPLEPIDFDIEIKGKERRTSSILDLLKKNEEQKNNLNKMEKSVDGLFEVIGKENIVYLSSRYGLDMKVILWGMIASDLEGEYDKEELEKIFDNRILNIVEGKIQERTKKSKVLSQKEETKSKIFVQLNQTDSLTQETILEIAKYIDQQLKRNDEKLTVDIALQEMTKKVATRFITRLEEQYFFRQYYAPSPEDFRRDDLLTEINRILSLEQGSITFDALSTILKKVEKANKTQQFLQSNGLNFKTHLNLYQQVAVQQMLEKRNALLADEMGLGKTLETIATFLASTEKEMLVLAPKKAVSRWLEDIVNHTDTEIEVVNLSSADIPNELKHNKKISFVEFNNLNKEERLKRKQYLYSQRPELPNGKKRVVIVNYDAMKIFERYRNANKLDVPTTDFIAMDEAHLLKNPKTNLYRVVFGDTNGQGAIQAKYKIVITGTPLENRISDLLSYLKYLARNDDSPEAQYINSISMEKFSRTFKVENLDKMAMLGGYLSEHMIRRLKDDVIKGLPIKKFVTVSLNPFEGTMILNGEEPISLPGSYDRQQALYDMVLKYPELFEKRYVKGNIKQVNEDTGFNEDDLSYSQTQVLRLEQVVSDPLLFDERIDNIKFDAVVRLIRERNVQGKSVLIFTDYKMMANHLKEYLKKELQNEVAYVDGDVEFSDRLKEVNKLQDKVVQNLVGTTGAIGTSIQATQAEAVIFLNFPWKSSTINQAIDRAHRIDKLRNYEGKELEIITLEYDVPVSIDRLKAMTVRIKEILTEMMINGNLTPEVLNAFYEVEKVSISEEIEKVYGDSHVAFDDYELSLMEQFQAKIVEILRETNPEVLKQLWDDISDIYLQILDNKSSYFANVASLDYLASDQFPELKRTKENPLKALDLASGPSTQYRAYHRQLEVFQEKGLYLDIYDYDRSQKMLDLGVVREGRQFIGAFENLDQIPESEFDIVNLSYAFRFASHPGKLIKNIHRILKKDGMFVLILPKNNKIPINFYTALEQAGFSIQKVNESKLKSSLYEETKYELQKEFGAELASDIIRQSNQQFTYLLVKKDNDIQGDLNDEDFRIEIQKAIVDSEKVEKLRKSKGRVKIVPRNARIKGTIETDVDGVEDKVSILKNRILTKIEKQLVSLTRFIRIYQEMAKDQKSYKRVKKIRLEIETQLDDLRIGIQEHIKLLKQEDVAILLESLINFKDNNFVRTWLNHNNKDFVVMLIKFIETEQQKIINLDSEIAEIDWAEPSSSPMEKESEPLGGIDLNPKNIDLDVQGTGIKYDLPEDVFEFDFPIHGFTPVIINIQPAPSLPVLLGEKKEEPTEHHQLSRI
ncbi:MAG: methyltransferase domain-containing protein [Candidatus Omnitrophica bacterium]|nr:methyltransferase domain-containing protein [Candidatus Omnitrophota bacterium]